jgi:hypothetical protein
MPQSSLKSKTDSLHIGNQACGRLFESQCAAPEGRAEAGEADFLPPAEKQARHRAGKRPFFCRAATIRQHNLIIRKANDGGPF